MIRFSILLITLLATFTLGACYSNRGIGPQLQQSFKSYTYKAVDKLLDQADKRITPETPLLVSTISDINNVEQSSAFGRTISEQISTRLAQKGYKVAELKLRQGISIEEGTVSPQKTGEFMLSRDPRDVAGKQKAAATVAGTYTVGDRNVLVNLRLIDIRTGNLITGQDYELPLSQELEVMLDNGNSNKGPVYFTNSADY